MEGASIKNTTNTVEEAKAILEASKHCKKSQHNQIIIQADSMLLYKALEGKWACPWIIAEMVTEIQSCLQNKQVNFKHILREGNKLATNVANFDIDRGTCTFTSFNNMETDARTLINNDKLLCPYLRVTSLRG